MTPNGPELARRARATGPDNARRGGKPGGRRRRQRARSGSLGGHGLFDRHGQHVAAEALEEVAKIQFDRSSSKRGHPTRRHHAEVKSATLAPGVVMPRPPERRGPWGMRLRSGRHRHDAAAASCSTVASFGGLTSPSPTRSAAPAPAPPRGGSASSARLR